MIHLLYCADNWHTVHHHPCKVLFIYDRINVYYIKVGWFHSITYEICWLISRFTWSGRLGMDLKSYYIHSCQHDCYSYMACMDSCSPGHQPWRVYHYTGEDNSNIDHPVWNCLHRIDMYMVSILCHIQTHVHYNHTLKQETVFGLQHNERINNISNEDLITSQSQEIHKFQSTDDEDL